MFRPRCRNEHQDLRVNASAARCVAPLVPTENSKSWFPNVDGCALQCNAYENANSDRFRLVLISGTLIAFACNAIALAGLAIGWRSLRRPSHFLAHINGCHVLHSLGWVVQLMAGRSHLVCRPDGTARFDEPAAGPACVLSLILLYFSSAAIVFWYIALAYAWGIVFGRRVGARQYLCQHTRHLHLATYGGAFALTVAALAFAHVDGSWNLGVCFITVQSGWARIFLLAVPLTISLLAVLALMCRNLRLLYIARKSERRPEKSFLIAQMMRRIGKPWRSYPIKSNQIDVHFLI